MLDTLYSYGLWGVVGRARHIPVWWRCDVSRNSVARCPCHHANGQDPRGPTHERSYIHMSVHMFMHMSIHMSVHMSKHMSIHMSIHISMHMSMHMSIDMSMHMSAHLPFALSGIVQFTPRERQFPSQSLHPANGPLSTHPTPSACAVPPKVFAVLLGLLCRHVCPCRRHGDRLPR